MIVCSKKIANSNPHASESITRNETVTDAEENKSNTHTTGLEK